ncbi:MULTISPECIES: hypothetical protein [Kocuria]|uniref:UspA domain-containing protein n=1 Tax=Kocuria rosea subsp. polaris TaxID=136273 RepID=A0A0W8I4F0_KOCRO|nr:hypothetical protein [Kocuria polaris]KUG52923.1 hypothetical protein AVL61_11915 [Kocuria polaris]
MTALAPRRPVAAVVTDGPESVTVARCAARIAAEQGRPLLLLLVPMLRSAFSADAVIAARVHREALREAEAVAARTRPVLDAAGVPARVQVVWHRSCAFRRARQGRAIALAHAAGRAGAAVVVTPAGLPLPTVRHGAEVLLVAAGAAALVTVRRPARSRGLAEL